MRVTYLTTDRGVPVLGTKGASVHVQQMVSALAQRGHEVLVLTTNRGDTCPPPPGCRVEELGPDDELSTLRSALKREAICEGSRLAQDLRPLLEGGGLEVRAMELLRAFRPDALYERYGLFGTTGVRLVRRLRVPHVVEVNAPLVEEQQEQRGLALPRVAQALQRHVFGEADELIVVSRWLEDYVCRHGADPAHVTVLPNAADAGMFAPGPGRASLRRQLGWEDATVLGFVGAMKTWHGVPTVVEALRQLGGVRSAFRLLLVGDGPDMPRVREQIAAAGLDGAVHLTGAVPHGEVPRWLAAADIALVPYGPAATPYFSPVKLFECMAMGLPVVAARLGQTNDVIEHGGNGWLYSASDPGEPAATIRAVAADRQAAARVGAAGRKLVLDCHTWASNAQVVEGLVERARGQVAP